MFDKDRCVKCLKYLRNSEKTLKVYECINNCFLKDMLIILNEQHFLYFDFLINIILQLEQNSKVVFAIFLLYTNYIYENDYELLYTQPIWFNNITTSVKIALEKIDVLLLFYKNVTNKMIDDII